VREDESHFPVPETTDCVLRTIRGLALPPPQGGAADVVLGIRFGSPPAPPPAPTE
jgi:hypothetical protein